MATLAFIQNLSPWHLLLLMMLGLLLFGKRLPEVGKSLGKGIVEFKKGLKSIEDDVDEASSRPAAKPRSPELPEDRASYASDERRVSRADRVEETAPPPGAAN